MLIGLQKGLLMVYERCYISCHEQEHLFPPGVTVDVESNALGTIK